jgi:hypothetical protein
VTFANLTTVFLNGPTNASALQWGTNVRKINAVSDALANETTTTNQGAGGVVSRTINPFGTSTTTGSQSNFGFGISQADMGGSTGARRFYRSGVHTFFCAAASSTPATSTDTNLVISVYRVQVAPTYTRVLIGSATGAPFNLGLVINTFQDISCSITLPEIIFEPGETIQYSVDVLAAGAAVTGRIITVRFGAATNRITSPELAVLADTNGTSSGLADVVGIGGTVLGANGSALGLATVNGTINALASTIGVTVGQANVSGTGASLASSNGVSVGLSVVSGIGGKIIGTVGTVDINGGGGAVPPGYILISPIDQQNIHRLALIHGLDAGNPLIVSAKLRSAGGLVQTVVGTDQVTITTISVPPLSGNTSNWIDGLAEIHGIHAPLTVTSTSRDAGAVHQTIVTDGVTTTVERQ